MSVETISAYDIQNDHWVYIFRRGANTLFCPCQEIAPFKTRAAFEEEMVRRAEAHFDRIATGMYAIPKGNPDA